MSQNQPSILELQDNNLGLICDALSDAAIVSFVQHVLVDGYVAHGLERVRAEELIADTLTYLRPACMPNSPPKSFVTFAERCAYDLYGVSDAAHWFQVARRRYKSKPSLEVCWLKEQITGQTVLDFGCGDGQLAIAVAAAGFSVWGVDVIVQPNFMPNVTYVQMHDSTHMSFPQIFDTTIVRLVLHHINESEQTPILYQIMQHTRHTLLIKEEVFGLSSWPAKTPPNILTQMYLSLSYQQQLGFLALMDFWGNVLAQGKFDMRLPCSFRRIQDWQRVLHAYGFEMQPVWCCFDQIHMHNSAHVWLYCQR